MDVKTINYLLDEIKHQADQAKKLLNSGNTGWQFYAALDLIVQHNADIRNDIQAPPPPHNLLRRALRIYDKFHAELTARSEGLR